MNVLNEGEAITICDQDAETVRRLDSDIHFPLDLTGMTNAYENGLDNLPDFMARFISVVLAEDPDYGIAYSGGCYARIIRPYETYDSSEPGGVVHRDIDHDTSRPGAEYKASSVNRYVSAMAIGYDGSVNTVFTEDQFARGLTYAQALQQGARFVQPDNGLVVSFSEDYDLHGRAPLTDKPEPDSVIIFLSAVVRYSQAHVQCPALIN